MNQWLNQLQQQWLSRTEQERQLMSVAGPLVLLAVLYFGIWQPLAEARDLAERQVAAERASLMQVKQNANLYLNQTGQGGGRASATAQGSLSQIASRTASSSRIVIERMQPQGDKLQLWIADVEFSRLMTWLAALQQQGIQISALDLDAAKEGGMVQVRRLQLSKP